jgi:hypothetical protein
VEHRVEISQRKYSIYRSFSSNLLDNMQNCEPVRTTRGWLPINALRNATPRDAENESNSPPMYEQHTEN